MSKLDDATLVLDLGFNTQKELQDSFSDWYNTQSEKLVALKAEERLGLFIKYRRKQLGI